MVGTEAGFIDTATWELIFFTINYGFWWAGLMIVAALLFLFAQALIPSLVLTAHLPVTANSFRPFFYLLSAIVAVLAFINVYQFLSTALSITSELYPRLII